MKFWHFNTCTIKNGEYMIRNKKAYKELGNSNQEYQRKEE